jgi:hypothetical protein
MNYNFIIKLQDLMSPALQRLNQNYSGTMATMNRITARFQSGFAKAAQTVDQLKRKLSFGKEGQSIDSLKSKLDALTRGRNLMVDTSDIRRANREIEALERRMQKMSGLGKSGGGGSGGGILGAFKGPLMGLMTLTALTAGAGEFLSKGMGREQTKVGLEQFVGKQGIDPMMKQLNTFANVTPYSNDEVYGSARTMLAAKVDPGQLNEKMTNVGNMAAVSQKDFGELSSAYAKIKAKGFADSGELHQEFGGTLLMDELKKNLKVSGEELFKMAEKRQIRFSDVDNAIGSLSAKGGSYEGGLEKQSATAGGKWSTFTGSLQDKFATWAEKFNPYLGKMFDFGTALISQIDPFLEKLSPLAVGFQKLWDATEPVRQLLADLFDFVTRLLAPFASLEDKTGKVNIIMEVLAAVIWTVSSAIQIVGNIFLWMSDNVITQVIAGVALLAIGLKVLWVLMVANPIGAIITGIVALVAGIKLAYDNVDWFRHGLIRLWEVGKSVFGSLGKAWETFKKGDFKGVGAAFASGWNEGQDNADKLINADKFARKMAAEQSKMKKKGTDGLSPNGTAPGAPGGSGKDLDKAAGVSSTVGGSKSNTITINIGKMIEKSEIHVNQFKEGVNELEEMVQDALLRIVNSANSVATP